MAKRNKEQRQQAKWARNKRAFVEIIGDPYAKPEPIEGHYAMLRSRSSISIAEPERESSTPINKARPSALDFFIDVDDAVADGLDVVGRQLGEKFINTYMVEDSSKPIFTQKERAEIEQAVGNILVARKISPATRYFTTIKQ